MSTSFGSRCLFSSRRALREVDTVQVYLCADHQRNGVGSLDTATATAMGTETGRGMSTD